MRGDVPGKGKECTALGDERRADLDIDHAAILARCRVSKRSYPSEMMRVMCNRICSSSSITSKSRKDLVSSSAPAVPIHAADALIGSDNPAPGINHPVAIHRGAAWGFFNCPEGLLLQFFSLFPLGYVPGQVGEQQYRVDIFSGILGWFIPDPHNRDDPVIPLDRHDHFSAQRGMAVRQTAPLLQGGIVIVNGRFPVGCTRPRLRPVRC